MQFIVTAFDGTDDKALERRMAVREAHLKSAKVLYETGKWLFATAILNNDGKMIGSMAVCDFPSLEKLHEEWLDNEPYVKCNVWQKIEIHRAQVPSFCLKQE